MLALCAIFYICRVFMKNILSTILLSFALSASIQAQDKGFSSFSSDCKIVAPNAFTPNDDGINDHFKLMLAGGCEVFKFDFKIYDRWGRMVFETADHQTEWDGNYDGQQMKEGVYFWYCNAQLGDKSESKKGSLVLVR